MIAGFRREAAENCALLGYYAAASGNFLPTIRESQEPWDSLGSWAQKMGPIGCPETTVRNYH